MSLVGQFNILYQDEHFVAIDKPPGFLVHPPEDSTWRVPASRICLSQLRRQLKKFVYPIHRIDVATSGILLWALHQEATSLVSKDFRDRKIDKTYEAVVRGWILEPTTVNLPLESDSTGDLLECQTHFKPLGKVELPYPVGKRYPFARYSWVQARPETGRYHQIRRHLNRISHPIVGDCDHGDSHHNRFFRDQLKIPGLCLRATEMEFYHPFAKTRIKLVAPPTETWSRVQKLFSKQDV